MVYLQISSELPTHVYMILKCTCFKQLKYHCLVSLTLSAPFLNYLSKPSAAIPRTFKEQPPPKLRGSGPCLGPLLKIPVVAQGPPSRLGGQRLSTRSLECLVMARTRGMYMETMYIMCTYISLFATWVHAYSYLPSYVPTYQPTNLPIY